jgi:5'-3' exoribonuclease 2
MGVPTFYRWLSEKYPRIVIDVIEQRPYTVDGIEVSGDAWVEYRKRG